MKVGGGSEILLSKNTLIFYQNVLFFCFEGLQSGKEHCSMIS